MGRTNWIFSELTLRSTVGILNKACCCSSCKIFISDVDDNELVGLELTVIGLLLIEWLMALPWYGFEMTLLPFWAALVTTLAAPVVDATDACSAAPLLVLMLLLLLLLIVMLLLKWLVKFELFIIEFEVWSIFGGLLRCVLLLLIEIKSLCGLFVNTGEFGAEWCW